MAIQIFRVLKHVSSGLYVTAKGCQLFGTGENCAHRSCALVFNTKEQAFRNRGDGEVVMRVTRRTVGKRSRFPLPYLVLRCREGRYRTKEGFYSADLFLADKHPATENERAVLHASRRKGERRVCIVPAKHPYAGVGAEAFS